MIFSPGKCGNSKTTCGEIKGVWKPSLRRAEEKRGDEARCDNYSPIISMPRKYPMDG